MRCVAAKVKLVLMERVMDVHLLVQKVKIAAMRCVPNLEPTRIALVAVQLVYQEKNVAVARA
jgi:hypothetical protein